MELHISRHGSKLNVKDGMFEVAWFDDDQNLHRESHSPLTIKSLWVQDGAVVSVAAHLLAWKHGIDMLLLDHFGMPQVCCIGFEINSTPSVQKAQVIVSQNYHAVAIVKHWIATKLQNQVTFFEKLKSRRDGHKKALLDERAKEIAKLRKKVLELDGKHVREIAETLRGLEGSASRVYFQTLSELLPDEHRFDARSRQPARDPFNAFLNYGYAVLYSRTEKALRLAGLSPFIGFFHADNYNHKSMLYDFVEQYRSWVDTVVFRLFSRKMVNATHTDLRGDAIVLNKVGIKLLIENLKEYLEEKKEELDGKIVSREFFMRQSAIRFARRAVVASGMVEADAYDEFAERLAA